MRSFAIIAAIILFLFAVGFFIARGPGKRPAVLVPAEQPTSPSMPTIAAVPVQVSTPTSTSRLVPSPVARTPGVVKNDVPFTSQAPSGQWHDARFQNACEEAAALMAMRWVEGRPLSRAEAERELLAIVAFEQETFGHFHDTAAADTVERIFRGYFRYSGVRVVQDIDTGDIKRALAGGAFVIVPVNGRLLGNSHYTRPGPREHNLFVIGYDPTADTFITHDPGTRHGAWYRYSAATLQRALRDYPTGQHEPFTSPRTAMVVVRRSPGAP